MVAKICLTNLNSYVRTVESLGTVQNICWSIVFAIFSWWWLRIRPCNWKSRQCCWKSLVGWSYYSHHCRTFWGFQLQSLNLSAFLPVQQGSKCPELKCDWLPASMTTNSIQPILEIIKVRRAFNISVKDPVHNLATWTHHICTFDHHCIFCCTRKFQNPEHNSKTAFICVSEHHCGKLSWLKKPSKLHVEVFKSQQQEQWNQRIQNQQTHNQQLI